MVILSHNRAGEFEDWDVQSQSSPDKVYLVTMDHDEKTVHCDCPDFQYRKNVLRFGGAKLTDVNNHCKHIKEILKEVSNG